MKVSVLRTIWIHYIKVKTKTCPLFQRSLPLLISEVDVVCNGHSSTGWVPKCFFCWGKCKSSPRAKDWWMHILHWNKARWHVAELERQWNIRAFQGHYPKHMSHIYYYLCVRKTIRKTSNTDWKNTFKEQKQMAIRRLVAITSTCHLMVQQHSESQMTKDAAVICETLNSSDENLSAMQNHESPFTGNHPVYSGM